MELLKKYPGIKLAQASDSNRLLKFFETTPMDATSLVLSYTREPDFFTFLTFQGEEVFVFLAENKDGEIAGVGTLTVREGHVNQKLSRIGYLSDLRVKKELMDKNFSQIWKEFMGELILNVKNINELKCDYLITAIMAGNQKAKKSLVNQPQNKFHYEKLCSYKMVNILSTLKQQCFDKTLKVSRCSDMSEALDYLETANKNRQFGFTRKFIQNAIMKWPGLNLSQFIKVEKNGKIVGMCATWNPSPIKKIIVHRLPWTLKILNAMAGLVTKTPAQGKEMEIQYLNFLTLENPHALAAIIDFLRSEGVFKSYHLLAFADYDHESHLYGLAGMIKDMTALELYQVVSKEHMEDIVELSGIPGFEISLV